MRSITKTNKLKEKCLKALEDMMPYNELSFIVIATYKKITAIKLEMRGEEITIKQGKMAFCNYTSEVKQCLVSIYKEFKEEIQALFEMEA